MNEELPSQVARQKAMDTLHFRVLVCVVVIAILGWFKWRRLMRQPEAG